MSQSTDEKYGKIYASWTIPEYVKHKRSFLWFFVFFLLMGFLVFFAIFSANFLFALIIVMILVIILVTHFRHPKNIKLLMTEDGIKVDDEFYEYKVIKEFWIIYNPPEVKTLYFGFKNFLRPRLAVYLDNQDPIKLREWLLNHIEENLEEEEESFADTLGRSLKI